VFKNFRLATVRFINLNRPNNTTWFDWDGIGDKPELPPGDLIGINAFSLDNEGKFHGITFGVTIAVTGDENLFRITDMVDQYYNLMLPEKTFDILDPTTQAVLGKAVFREGTVVHAVTRFETKIVQSVQGAAVVTLAG